MRDNAKLCIFLQPLSPPFTFPIVTHPWPPHTPLLAQAVNWIVCMQWVCESMSLPVCVCVWGEGAPPSSLPENPHARCPQCCCLSPLAGGRYVGFMAEAVRRGLPGSPRSQYMHAHHPVPSLLKECLPGGLGVRRGVAYSPVKLSFGLCEQVGISILARASLLSTTGCL